MIERNNSCVTDGDDYMGMTDTQYKGMLLDQLRDWKQVLAFALESKDIKVQEKAEKMIDLINKKLKF